MKNIQVIDAANNCAYDIFQATEAEFKLIFPEEGQDIQFNQDVEDQQVIREALNKIWTRIINKKNVNGIHGTLFYQLPEKKEYYPNKKESDLTQMGGRQRDCGF